MGSSTSSKFIYAIKKGDETKAIEIYTTDEKFAQSFNLGEKLPKYENNTALHFICEWGLADLLELVLPLGDKNHSRSDNKHAHADLRKISVTVPDGKFSGQTFMAKLPSGRQMLVSVPRNAGPGTTLTVSYRDRSDPSLARNKLVDPRINNNNQMCALELLVSRKDRASQRHRILQHLWKYSQQKQISLLLNKEYGANKWTLLHMCAAYALSECAFFLIDHGSSLEVEDSKGHTPAVIAEIKGHGTFASRLEAMMIFHPLHIHEANQKRKELNSLTRAIDLSHQPLNGVQGVDKLMKEDISAFKKECNVKDSFVAERVLSTYGWKLDDAIRLWNGKTTRRQVAELSGVDGWGMGVKMRLLSSPDYNIKRNGEDRKEETKDGEATDNESNGVAEQMDDKNSSLKSSSEEDLYEPKCLACGQQMEQKCKKKGGERKLTISSLAKDIVKLMSKGTSRGKVIKILRQEHPPSAIMKALQEATTHINSSHGSNSSNDQGHSGSDRATSSGDQGSEREQVEKSEEEEKKADPLSTLVEVSMCQHIQCVRCWKGLTKVSVFDQRRGYVKCGGDKCRTKLGGREFETMIGLDHKTKNQRLRWVREEFVRSRSDIKYCPHPDCPNAVKRQRRGLHVGKIAECKNGHAFCFECGGFPHDPATCDQARKWHETSAKLKAQYTTKSKNSDSKQTNDLATLVWLAKNTKACPKCNTNIQKNEGCNHMTCSKCSHQFCWICMGPWAPHNKSYYTCNMYKGPGPATNKEENKRIRQTVKETERLTHFLGRFQAHFASSLLEQKRVATAEKRMEELQQATPEAVSTTFVKTAFRELYFNRVALCGSYIYRYYSRQEHKEAKGFSAAMLKGGGIQPTSIVVFISIIHDVDGMRIRSKCRSRYLEFERFPKVFIQCV